MTKLSFNTQILALVMTALLSSSLVNARNFDFPADPELIVERIHRSIRPQRL
jgi:hypothetical protein